MLAAVLFSLTLAQAVLPSPCPSSQPARGAVAIASPCPSATPALPPEIGRVEARNRRENLMGKVQAASEGDIGPEEIATRPLLRPGEVLEAIPGLVISQHSGGGKANQYYLRGFQLDHGTDLAGTIVGAPINLPTHAHGQGYSDVNWLLPELVSYVTYKKGPYYADEGDFSTAGSYDLFYRNTIPPIVQVGVGSYGYGRLFAAGSPKVGAGSLLYAVEAYHDDASLVKPDDYRKLDGVLRYSRSTATTDFNVTAMGYGGRFDSSDQIPQRLVDAGILSRYGALDPSDGGITHRYALTAQLQHHAGNITTTFDAFGVDSYLDLFSNFTYFADNAADYYNVTRNPVTCNAVYSTCAPDPAQHVRTYTPYCPSDADIQGTSPDPARSGRLVPGPFAFGCGDQREQQDKRFISGFRATRTWETPRAANTIGIGLRNDNISTVGLFLTKDRIRYPNGTLSDDHVVERDESLWAQSVQHLGPRVRVVAGVRGDVFRFDVRAFDPANSGMRTAGIVVPKLAAAYRIDRRSELYLNFGESFHSNDGRGVTQVLDPQTHARIDPSGAAVENVSPLVRTAGEEVGYRYAAAKINSTVSLWRLNIASELVFDGDHGTTFAGRPTVRQGIELANFFTPTPWLAVDADVATSTARFLTDPEHIGTGVPESLNAVVSLGATVDKPHYAASLRMRYFGPRTLIEDGSARSQPSTLFNAQLTAKSGAGRLTLDVLNVFNAQADDIEYYYGSWTPQDAANAARASDAAVNPALGGGGVSDYHFHPSQKRTVRLTLTRNL